MDRAHRLLGAAARWLCVGAMSAPLAFAAPAYSKGSKHTIGLVLTSWNFALYETPGGKEECPTGFDHDDKQQMLATQGGAEQFKTYGAYEARGPNGESARYHPWLVEDPLPFPELKAAKGFGLNLDGTADGRATDKTCRHEKFTGPDGEPVDNQMARVVGCTPAWRPDGFAREFIGQEFENSSLNRMVVEIAGVDDERNDPEVEVTFAKGKDKLVSSAPRKFVPFLIQRIDERFPHLISRTRGRIVDGVLITDPIPALERSVLWVTHQGELRMTDARLHLKLSPEGAEGYVAGYEDLKVWWNMYSKATPGMLGPYSHAGQYKAAARYADGDKDPATGQCRAISTTYKVTAVRALIPRPPAPADPGRMAMSGRRPAGTGISR